MLIAALVAWSAGGSPGEIEAARAAWAWATARQIVISQHVRPSPPPRVTPAPACGPGGCRPGAQLSNPSGVVSCKRRGEAQTIVLRRLRAATIEAARRIVTAIRPSIAAVTAPTPPLEPLERLRLTDGVARLLFDEYAAHRTGDRGDEETGWALMGYRVGDTATVVATLPAGADRDAGAAHVRFDPDAQAVASRIVRQDDKRLALLGIAHTHPGSLRRPSEGDLRGDRQWVKQLRGGEGVFGIGTADAKPEPQPGVLWQPKPHRQCLGGLSWCWYSLADGDIGYRPLSVEVTLGADRAEELRPVWPVIEAHAGRLDGLARQLAHVRFAVTRGSRGPALSVTVPRPGRDEAIRVVLDGKDVRYFLERGAELLAADLPEPRVDQGVYLLLAECAARATID